MILIAFAFLAGLVTILSPCILPLVPLVLATGSNGGKGRPLGVVLGLIASFSFFTLTLTALVAALGIPDGALRWIAVVMLALFGLALLIPAFGARLEPLFGRLASVGAGRGGSGLAGGLVLGATLGLVWAPCVGPIMASVIVLAATQGVTPLMAAITVAYATGAGIPLLAVAYGGRALAARLRGRLGRAGARVPQLLGALMLVTCGFIATGQDLRLQTVAGSYLPGDWTANLTAIENQAAVNQELDTLRGQSADGAAAGAADFTPLVAEVPPAMPKDTPVPPTATPVPVAAVPHLNLPDMGAAPELVGTGQWFNSEPTTIAALRGKVVIVDFWTFACYNCNNTLPYVKAWYDKYAAQGLVILGVHTPEFAYEHEAANVADAIKEKGITFPVVQDNDYKTWSAYKNNYWPMFYFIDANGHIRHTHIGEGAYDESEQVIRQLLAEAKGASAPGKVAGLAAPVQFPALPPAEMPQAIRPPTRSTPVPTPRPRLPDLGPAAELVGTGKWFNSPATSLKALRGKVVVVNFWTFGCYNCNNTLPYVKAWYDKYAAQGLVILGVHSPEFAYERDSANVANAIRDRGIKYPVVQDNNYKTWQAYKNSYWPMFYFIDAKGHVRYTHIGEGAYDQGEQVIQQLLAEAQQQ